MNDLTVLIKVKQPRPGWFYISNFTGLVKKPGLPLPVFRLNHNINLIYMAGIIQFEFALKQTMSRNSPAHCHCICFYPIYSALFQSRS